MVDDGDWHLALKDLQGNLELRLRPGHTKVDEVD